MNTIQPMTEEVRADNVAEGDVIQWCGRTIVIEERRDGYRTLQFWATIDGVRRGLYYRSDEWVQRVTAAAWPSP